MPASLFGYFFGMITVLTGAVVLFTSVSNISSIGNGRHHLRPPVIGRTVAVEIQRRPPPVVKEEARAKDASPVVHTAKMESKKASITSPKWSPVTPTTTAMGTRGVMLLGTVQAVSFSADP
jgi:hypothetical protein